MRRLQSLSPAFATAGSSAGKTSSGVRGEDESEEEEPKEPQPKFRLFICDRGNSRIVVWNELPYPKEEEVEEEFEELRVDDENSLIGEEEDEDDLEEEEEVPPGEPLSA
mgnify:CR=1 FL=1